MGEKCFISYQNFSCLELSYTPLIKLGTGKPKDGFSACTQAYVICMNRIHLNLNNYKILPFSWLTL